jgi:hypothetical protein
VEPGTEEVGGPRVSCEKRATTFVVVRFRQRGGEGGGNEDTKEEKTRGDEEGNEEVMDGEARRRRMGKTRGEDGETKARRRETRRRRRVNGGGRNYDDNEGERRRKGNTTTTTGNPPPTTATGGPTRAIPAQQRPTPANPTRDGDDATTTNAATATATPPSTIEGNARRLSDKGEGEEGRRQRRQAWLGDDDKQLDNGAELCSSAPNFLSFCLHYLYLVPSTHTICVGFLYTFNEYILFRPPSCS